MELEKLFSLAGKNALVTGASDEAGLCCGMAAALRGAGARVVLLDISEKVHALAERMGGAGNGYYSVQCDLCDEASLEAAFDKVLAICDGRLDILLNGAGIQYRCEAQSFPLDAWSKVIDVNLKTVFYMSQIAAKNMIKHGGGKIINVASMTSYAASKSISAYSASKGGVMQLTKALSNEWCSLGINVNAIAPGYMKTKLTADLIETDLGKLNTARIPAGRWGEGSDLVGTIIFLASAASDYVSGAIIPVDGGFLGF